MLAFSQAAENNKEPIARVLREAFKDVRSVLEIGSGTGQHAVHFGRALPQVTWQPSDLATELEGLRARLAAEAPPNVAAPVELDVAADPWPVASVDGVFSANCVHIVAWPMVAALFRGVGAILEARGVVCLYGPFKYGGAFTTDSNARFDAWLRARDPASGIRDFESVDKLAQARGLTHEDDIAMPANNRLSIWRRPHR